MKGYRACDRRMDEIAVLLLADTPQDAEDWHRSFMSLSSKQRNRITSIQKSRKGLLLGRPFGIHWRARQITDQPRHHSSQILCFGFYSSRNLGLRRASRMCSSPSE